MDRGPAWCNCHEGADQTGHENICAARRRSPSSRYPAIDLFAWQPKDGSRNFGDHLSHIVSAAVAAERGFTFEDEVPAPRRLLAIGSILHFAQDGDVVWGSGINGKISMDGLRARKLDIRAVRGPRTAAVLKDLGFDVPRVYGDPALLVPRYFGDRFPLRPRRDFVFIPNLHDLARVEPADWLISPLRGWNYCVEAITTAKLVLASSLHGIILAEAFGVPARFVRLSETESQFKYDDYAQGTGRAELRPAHSIEEGLDLGGHEPASFDEDGLVGAFPFDLWAARERRPDRV